MLLRRLRQFRCAACILILLSIISACQLRPTEPLVHPRLFFSPSESAQLRQRAATTHQGIWQPIVAFAETQIESPLSNSPHEASDLDTYRNAGNGLIALAFACYVGNAADVCEAARTQLLTYAKWQQWDVDGERDLGLAHMIMGNALAYDWLADQLASDQRQTVEIRLAAAAQELYEASTATETNEQWHNWWRNAISQNHSWTNHSALGMAGLALLGEDERAQRWVDLAVERLRPVSSLLDGIADGSWHEGMTYQNYGLTMLLPFFVNVRRIQGIDLFPHTYLRNYPSWRIYNDLPNSTEFALAFGDFEKSWGNSYSAQNILRFCAGEYDDGHAEWMARQLIAADPHEATVWAAPWYVFEFLYYNPEIAAQPPDDLPLSRVFPDLSGVIWRTGWEQQDLVFGLKTGAYGGRFAFDTFTQQRGPWQAPCASGSCALHIGHDHDDTNGFYLYVDGRWLVPEVSGLDKPATSLHNTILIDGQGQDRPPEDHFGQQINDFVGGDGELQATASSPNFDYLAADATGRYRQISGITAVNRQVVFVRPGYLVLFDNFAARDAHQYTSVIHTSGAMQTEGSWIRAAAGDDKFLGIAIAAPKSFTSTLLNDGLPTLHLSTQTSVTEAQYITLLYPTTEAGWNDRPTVTPLFVTKEAGLVRVQSADLATQIDDVLVRFGKPGDVFIAGSYVFNGRVAVVSRTGNGELTRLFCYGGTNLAVDGKTLVSNLRADESFEANYNEEMVSVSGNLQGGIRLYAPNATELLVNGQRQSFTRDSDYITFVAAQ